MKTKEHMTPRERAIFNELQKKGKVFRGRIHELCFIDESKSNVADVHIKNLRKKLPKGMKIVTSHGSKGYEGWYELEVEHGS